jgi:hypothetical protein
MQPYPYKHRSRRPTQKLPPSGPPEPPRKEICILKPRTSIPSDETLNEMIALAPEWLRDRLCDEVPREIYAEAAGQTQLLPKGRAAQTTFLEKAQGKDNA